MNQRVFSCRSLAITSLATGTILGGGYYYANAGPPYPQETTKSPPPWTSPSRDDFNSGMRLKKSLLCFNLIRVRVVAGASKSTKLVHGSVRYFWKAVARTPSAAQEMTYSRAQFEAGEVIALRDAPTARVQRGSALGDETHLERADVIMSGLIKSLGGCESGKLTLGQVRFQV